MHDANRLSILDLGTPVALLGTLSEDGTLHLAAVTSVWWMGARCVLGLPGASKTSANLRRTREIVINMPSSEQGDAVDRLVRVAGRAAVLEHELDRGYRCKTDKIGILGLSSVPSETVRPTRVMECPIQLEAVLEGVHDQGPDGPLSGGIEIFEVRVTHLHLDGSILMDGHSDRIEPERWRPLMSRLG